MSSLLDKYKANTSEEESGSLLERYKAKSRPDPLHEQYQSEELSPENIQQMSLSDRMAKSQELKTEREYLQSRGFAKGALSGLTLGATEHIESLKPQEDDLHSGFGETVGSLAPLGLTYKAVSIPIKYAVKGFTKYPKAISAVSKLMTAFGTGSSYETEKELVKGEGLDPKTIALRGAEFATIDALFRGGGTAFNWIKGLSPSQQTAVLEKGIIPEDLPKSQYETAEKILEQLKSGKSINDFDDIFPPPPPPPGASPAISTKRITNPKDIDLRPTPSPKKEDLADKIGDIFSKNRFYNTTQGGQAIKNEIMDLDQEVYRGVGELYNISRELNKDITEIHPNLAQQLLEKNKEIQHIPEPSDVQKRLLKASENILNSIAEIYEGTISGYKPMNNQTLIDQIQSLRQIIDYDFSHGNTKNIFRPLINDLENAVVKAAEHSGNEEAIEALNNAKSGYRAWVEAFDNDYVRPFRDSSNKDFSKLFKSSLDFDESNVLRSILNLSERGRELSNASVREIVEKQLDKFSKNPTKIDQREFDKTLRELESVITPEQSKQIKQQFHEAQKKLPFKAKAKEKIVSPEEQVAAKYMEKTPEDIQQMMSSRTGIKKLKEELKGTEGKKKLFDTLKKQKIRSILREGNIEKEFTGDDLYKFLNKEKNYELISEFLGEETAESMRLEAKKIGKAQMRRDKTIKMVKNASAIKGVMFLLSLL